ncbi:TTN [Symbiodinium sp. CCMP2456]|nr:TTN [Symbiodinium sp. CCMP2456]
MAILPLPQRISVQPPEEDVPGLVPKAILRPTGSETHAGASPTVHSVQVVSQNEILGMDVRENCTGTGCSSSAFQEQGACGILLRWAFLLKGLILALFLSELVLAILVLQYGHVHGVAWDFTAVSLTVYFMVGYGGVVLLAQAFASEELKLVALKLQLHFNDERRTELLRRERWKYALAWFAFMASVVVHQGFEVWNIQRGVLDDTIVRLEDLPVAKVCAQINEAVTIISFAFVSAVILVTCYIQSVLLLAVDGALDDWCLEVYDSQDYEVGVKTWNRMQALLKCLGRELETSTILLQAFGGIGFVAYCASAVSVVIQASFESLSLSMIAGAGAPAIFLLMIAIRLGAQAAALTEKCRVLPAFVNTIPGACIDLHRQYLVQFIVDTSAGFIVKGVTLTQAMFLKQLYLLATVLTGLLGIFIRLYL